MRITLEGDDRQTLIARLGLSSDASDADVTAAVTNRILAEANTPTPQPAPAPGAPPAAPTAPAVTPSGPQPGSPTPSGEGEGGEGGDLPAEDDEDVEVVDVAAYRALVARAGQADQLEEAARITRRDQLVASAVRAGKFPPSRRAHYATRYDTDPEATEAAINRMADNVVPVKERGVDVSEEELQASDAYPKEWVSGGHQPAPASTTNAGGERRSRVITED
jgi:hypothetical protein